ncbi:MAG: hypothetical protein WCO84_01095 [bacterium]
MLVIKYNIEDFKDIISMGDFYKKLGMYDMFEKKIVTNVSQMFMEKENCEKLLEFMKSNYKKNKEIKHYHQKQAHNLCTMDWINYSPVSKDDISKDEFWINLDEVEN